jgi:hypothetical protein
VARSNLSSKAGTFRYVSAFQYADHVFFFGVPSIESLLRQIGSGHVRTYRYSNLPEAIISTQLKRLWGLARHDGSADEIREAESAAVQDPELLADRGRKRVLRGASRAAKQALDLLCDGLHATVGTTGLGRRSLQTLVVVANKPA